MKLEIVKMRLKEWTGHNLQNFRWSLLKMIPTKILYWFVIEAGARVTIGKYASTEVCELTLMETIKRLAEKPYRKGAKPTGFSGGSVRGIRAEDFCD